MNGFPSDIRLFHPSLVSSLKSPPLSLSLPACIRFSKGKFLHTCLNRERRTAVGHRKDRIKQRSWAGRKTNERARSVGQTYLRRSQEETVLFFSIPCWAAALTF
ncbi:hypothetical protein ILYODFUR_022876 [Ilyodon furcidens]|uniref:Uncharacterized protein n=1 Tax=Ilyodon furcidens TaxID=33524 RepID=A0ABV0UY97_9TELE